MVAGFVASAPNATLVALARQRLTQAGMHLVDIGCGAGRNAIPLAECGWNVTGLDLSWPMVKAAVERAHDSTARDRLQFALAPMDSLPVIDGGADLNRPTSAGLTPLIVAIARENTALVETLIRAGGERVARGLTDVAHASGRAPVPAAVDGEFGGTRGVLAIGHG